MSMPFYSLYHPQYYYDSSNVMTICLIGCWLSAQDMQILTTFLAIIFITSYFTSATFHIMQ